MEISESTAGPDDLQLAVVAQDLLYVGCDLENVGTPALRERLDQLLSRDEIQLGGVRERIAELLRCAQEQTVPESDIAAGDTVQNRCMVQDGGLWPRFGLDPLGPGLAKLAEQSMDRIVQDCTRQDCGQDCTSKCQAKGHTRMRAKSLDPSDDSVNLMSQLRQLRAELAASNSQVHNERDKDGAEAELAAAKGLRAELATMKADDSVLRAELATMKSKLTASEGHTREVSELHAELMAARSNVHREEAEVRAHASAASELRAEAAAAKAYASESAEACSDSTPAGRIISTEVCQECKSLEQRISSESAEWARFKKELRSQDDKIKAQNAAEATWLANLEDERSAFRRTEKLLALSNLELSQYKTICATAEERERCHKEELQQRDHGAKVLCAQVQGKLQLCEQELSQSSVETRAMYLSITRYKGIFEKVEEREACLKRELSELEVRNSGEKVLCAQIRGKLQVCEQRTSEQQELIMKQAEEQQRLILKHANDSRHAQEKLGSLSRSYEERLDEQQKLIVEQADYLVYQRMKLDDYQMESDRLWKEIREKTALFDALEASEKSELRKELAGKYLQGRIHPSSSRRNAWEPFAETIRQHAGDVSSEDLESFLTRKASFVNQKILEVHPASASSTATSSPHTSVKVSTKLSPSLPTTVEGSEGRPSTGSFASAFVRVSEVASTVVQEASKQNKTDQDPQLISVEKNLNRSIAKKAQVRFESASD